MSFDNPWFWFAIISALGLYKLELIATLLNLSALNEKVPEPLQDSITQDEHDKALEYARVSSRFEIIRDSVSLGAFFAFWWCGGFGWLDQWSQSWQLGSIETGLAIIALLILAQSLISLPFNVYDTFVIEAEFGFNKTTLRTFIGDRIKGLALGAILGLPLLAFLIWLFQEAPFAALYGWLTVTAFSLIMSFVAPRLIMPLFYKFEPLPNAELREAIVAMGKRLGFPVSDVSMVNGSKRSTKANAFFTGFGKTKRIALYDTLINHHSQDEILAVLAHEIGHFKRRHVIKQLVLSIAMTGLMFGALHLALNDARLSAAFGVSTHSVAWTMVFFSMLYQPISTLLGLISSSLSRKFEFEADAYAKEAMAGPKPLAEALTRLSRDHLSNPTPHPFYVFLHYSHPPVLQRLAALGS